MSKGMMKAGECIQPGCHRRVYGFFCEEHQAECIRALIRERECEHDWLKGRVAVEEVSPGLYERLGEPQEGAYWQVCRKCGEKRQRSYLSLLKPKWGHLNGNIRKGRAA